MRVYVCADHVGNHFGKVYAFSRVIVLRTCYVAFPPNLLRSGLHGSVSASRVGLTGGRICICMQKPTL